MMQISSHLLLNFVRSQLSPAVLLEKGATPLVASHCSNLRQQAQVVLALNNYQTKLVEVQQ